MVVFYLLAFAFTWSYWVPRALISRGFVAGSVPDALALLAGYGPALAAVLTAFMFDGASGLRPLLRGLVRWRVGLRWYAAALLLPGVITLTAIAMNVLLGMSPGSAQPGDQSPIAPGPPLWQRALLLVVMFTLGFDGLGEELGWRGFALPRLLERYSALTASLIVGALWAAWHLPYALTDGTAMSGAPFLSFLPGMFAAAILYTWIFSNTQGSVLLAILFHAANNTTYHLLPALVPAAGDTGNMGLIVQWAVVAAVVLIEGPDRLSRIVPARPAVVPGVARDPTGG